MKNNRKIEVGQVRQVVDGSHNHLYFIISYVPRMSKFYVEMLTGNDKGCRFYWHKRYVEKDIVVM